MVSGAYFRHSSGAHGIGGMDLGVKKPARAVFGVNLGFPVSRVHGPADVPATDNLHLVADQLRSRFARQDAGRVFAGCTFACRLVANVEPQN